MDSLGDGIETRIRTDVQPQRVEYLIDGHVAVMVLATSPPSAHTSAWSMFGRSAVLRYAVALIYASDRMNQIEYEQSQTVKLDDKTT